MMNQRTRVCYGMTIYPRGKRKNYTADFHYGGQHRRRSLKTTNKKIAVDRAFELAIEVQRGTLDQASEHRQAPATVRTTLVEAIEAFLKAKRTSGNRPTTLGKYRGTLTRFADFAAMQKTTRVDQVALTLIDAYRSLRSEQKVRGKKLGPMAKHQDMALLKRFLKWCVDRQLIGVNPMANESFSRPTLRRLDRVLTLEDVDAILAALPKRHSAPAAVLAFTGMRSSNCRHLLVEDVDLNAGWIYVRSREGAETKCGNEWKTPIHPRLAAIPHSLPMPKEGYVFTSPPSRKYPQEGRWIDARQLNDEFVDTLKKLDLPAGRGDGFTLHSLRHFFKSFCISNGVPREYVDAWQGDAGIRSAADLYAHTLDTKSVYWMSRVPFGDMPAVVAG